MDFIEKGKKSCIWRTNGTKIRLTREYFACQFHYTLLLYATNYWNSIYEQEWHMFVLWHKPFWFMQYTYLVLSLFFFFSPFSCVLFSHFYEVSYIMKCLYPCTPVSPQHNSTIHSVAHILQVYQASTKLTSCCLSLL